MLDQGTWTRSFGWIIYPSVCNNRAFQYILVKNHQSLRILKWLVWLRQRPCFCLDVELIRQMSAHQSNSMHAASPKKTDFKSYIKHPLNCSNSSAAILKLNMTHFKEDLIFLRPFRSISVVSIFFYITLLNYHHNACIVSPEKTVQCYTPSPLASKSGKHI